MAKVRIQKSAVTGKFQSNAAAARWPSQTYKQTVRRSTKKSK